jgi:hypothetical protein
VSAQACKRQNPTFKADLHNVFEVAFVIKNGFIKIFSTFICVIKKNKVLLQA